MPKITAHLAAYVRIRRHELGLSLEQVASRAGSSKAHIWAIERGRSKNPTLWLLLSLCDALQCSLNSLIGADVSQPIFTDEEIALISAHRRIFGKESASEVIISDVRNSAIEEAAQTAEANIGRTVTTIARQIRAMKDKTE
jgi:transcriptional regulator with XRE-family HTH domain